MAVELYNDGKHRCLAFDTLVAGEGVQANQFLIVDGEHTALLDPGGDMTYTPLSLALGRHIRVKNLDYVLASHQDPDIIASLDSWLMYTDCKVVCSELWMRFLPHLVPTYRSRHVEDRIIGLPDRGGRIPMGESRLVALPAHFLHSVGNFHFYDPVSRILFSGDVGASIVEEEPSKPVTDFKTHLPTMIDFHRRYMTSNRACRLWSNMVRGLDVDMIVPQHGRPFRGEKVINEFLDWFGKLECGVDLITQVDYQIR